MKTFFAVSTATMLTLVLAGCTSASTNEDHGMTMSMEDMTQSLQGKTGDDFDKAFIEAMIPHHEGAIEMAKIAQQNAKHEAIRTLANQIIDAQQKEIDLMNEWKAAWGY